MKYLPNNLFVSCVILSLIAAPQVQANWFSKGLDLLKGSSSENTEETSDGNTSIVSNLLSNDTLIEGFKEALAIGSEKVSSQLSADGGFSADELIHIPLPDNLKTAQSVLGRIGLSSLGDDLELKLNQAAEAAVPEAKELFVNAIQSMTFEDIQAIYKGPNDSATQFFKANMADDLSERMLPIIDQTLSQVGAVSTYENFIGKYDSIPFVPDLKANLNTYVVEKGLEGLFYYLGKEEAAIRENPVERTTELLQQVFGAK